MSESTSTPDAQVIVNTALLAAEPVKVGDDLLVHNLGHTVTVTDLGVTRDKYRDAPRRKTGTFKVHDAQSFCRYMKKHADDEAEVWADTIGYKMVGVINCHTAESAGWADHRVTYAVDHTKSWKAWAEADGKLLSQTQFAELIEDRSIDIVEPSAADMLELSQTFEATTGVRFESTQAISSGERQFEYREQVEAKAGRAGRLTVPKEFILALKPFEGAAAYKVTARLRYRIREGALSLGFRLERPEDVLRDAFEDVVAAVEVDVTQPVFRGVSP